MRSALFAQVRVRVRVRGRFRVGVGSPSWPRLLGISMDFTKHWKANKMYQLAKMVGR